MKLEVCIILSHFVGKNKYNEFGVVLLFCQILSCLLADIFSVQADKILKIQNLSISIFENPRLKYFAY